MSAVSVVVASSLGLDCEWECVIVLGYGRFGVYLLEDLPAGASVCVCVRPCVWCGVL